MSSTIESDKFQLIDLDKLKLNLRNVKWSRLELMYRGEGNDNLVLNLPNIKHILRFHKSNTTIDAKTENEKLKIFFLYHYIFMKCIFTNAYTSVPIIVQISNSEVKELDMLFHAQRPDHRKEKNIFHNVVEVYPDCAFLPDYDLYSTLKKDIVFNKAPETNYLKELLSDQYVDYRSFVFSLLTNIPTKRTLISKTNEIENDTMCVEIKPKQGWTGASDMNFGLCSFCLNQYFKLDINKIGARTKYCPLDLFSGNTERMKHALRELLKTPQNNLKIFKNGQVVFDEKYVKNIEKVLSSWFSNENPDRCIENFCDLMVKILTYEFINKNEEIISLTCEVEEKNIERKMSYSNMDMESVGKIMNMSELKCRREGIILPDRSVLGRIFALQKIDEGGLQNALDFYENHINEFNSEFGYIYNLISRVQFNEKIQLPQLNVVEAYLLSAAAKDLSILVALKNVLNEEESSSEFVFRSLNEKNYEVKVSLVDVGPKPISCIKKHWKRNENIINSYLKYYHENLSVPRGSCA